MTVFDRAECGLVSVSRRRLADILTVPSWRGWSWRTRVGRGQSWTTGRRDCWRWTLFIMFNCRKKFEFLLVSNISPPPSERGNDGLPHSEPGVLSANSGHHGGQWLVPGQLQPGPEAGLGPRPRLWLCHEELQVLDGSPETEVRGHSHIVQHCRSHQVFVETQSDYQREPVHRLQLSEYWFECVCCCRRHSVTPFCDTVRASPLQLTCRQDQLAVAVCNLQRYPQELPLEYQVHTHSSQVEPNLLPGKISWC